jgi:hypothetical protein
MKLISNFFQSSDAEAGVEGDDEFECDCNICQYPRETREMDRISDNSKNSMFYLYSYGSLNIFPLLH